MAADPPHARHAAWVRALGAEELDALLVPSRANIRYLTGFSGSAALAVATRADLLLGTDFRYDEQARAEAGGRGGGGGGGAGGWGPPVPQPPCRRAPAPARSATPAPAGEEPG